MLPTIYRAPSPSRIQRTVSTLVLLLSASVPSCSAAPVTPASLESKPLPDIPTLLRSVEAHQKELDRVREDYTFHEIETLTTLDKNGQVRKKEVKESYDFFVHGHQIRKLIRRDGKDLSPDDARKEEERATRDALKYSKPDAANPDKDDISVSRLLEILSFSNPHRLQQEGRSIISIDFTGDPHAKTHDRNENVVKRVSGTMWIDEAAREVTRMNVSLNDNFRLGFGLLATVEKGSTFSFNQALVRNEAWLPTAVDGHFDGKAALFVGFHMRMQVRYDDYRKFGAEATERPGAVPVSSPK